MATVSRTYHWGPIDLDRGPIDLDGPGTSQLAPGRTFVNPTKQEKPHPAGQGEVGDAFSIRDRLRSNTPTAGGVGGFPNGNLVMA